MNALILGGASPRHYEWVRQGAAALQPHVDQVRYLDYRHWPSGGETNVAHELEQAAAAVAEFDEEYVIVAKSIGTIITVLGVANGRLAPVRCVLLGLPLKIVKEEWRTAEDLKPLTKHVPSIEDALARLPLTVIVQNEHDPASSAEEVQALVSVSGNSQLQLMITPGDTHDYVDWPLIARLAIVQAS